MKNISMPRQPLIILGAIVLFFVIAFALASNSAPNRVAASATTVAASKGDLRATVNAIGKVRAKKSARLALPVSGYIATIEKYEGDQVNAGDVILTLRAEDAARRVKQVELNLSSRQLDLARAKAAPRDEDIEIARTNLRKATLAVAAVESAYDAAPTAQNAAAREAARLDLEIARAQFNRVVNGPSKEEIELLQNAVNNAKLELEAAQNSLTQTKLTAPFTGTVTEINVRPGELVGGFNPLAAVADLNALEIAAEIDEIDVATTDVGQSVEVRLDAFPGERFAGRIARLYPAASTQRGSTVYGAVVDIDPRTFKVRPGMGASLKIATIEKKNVLLVPNRALKNVGARKAVTVAGRGDVIVEVGVSDGTETEIVSGLNEGDQIVIP
ncbi:MAG: efflux RND transporter periplasmic adaptor subunit [Chloroflexi bacterium]|nr:efflux RND transporter periplasmic adaptor subunit [Chloroflexota bacterium]